MPDSPINTANAHNITLTLVLISHLLSYKNSKKFLTAASNRHETTTAGIVPPLFTIV
jgi:hypothetical protein